MNTPVAEELSSCISSGTTINISELGIRYVKTICESDNNEISSELGSRRYGAQPIEIRKINFCLPGYKEVLNLTCSVVTETILNKNIETSCEFIFMSDDKMQAIREYVNNTMS